MKSLGQRLIRWKIWAQLSGQDLIEYALMAGFVTVAAAAIMPGMATHISQIFFQGGLGTDQGQRQLADY